MLQFKDTYFHHYMLQILNDLFIDTDLTFKEEPKWNFVRLCMCYYYISLHNNREIYVQNASTS